VDIPLVAYDIPVCVHTKLARSTVTTLAKEGTIIGLKDSSGDDGNFRYALLDLVEHEDVFLMTGSETVVD
ncbi:dihydrodipicolinate synthase family protein, partial [Salmonella enterica subsp. enterica serovar Istanbul]|nr:dihydrodipicolinate synthase family protein [Salmonella enterica subsp. enterica serovar Istanbul]